MWGKRPPLTHALWLLVLLKLITPPLFPVPIAFDSAQVEAKPHLEVPDVIAIPEIEAPPVAVAVAAAPVIEPIPATPKPMPMPMPMAMAMAIPEDVAVAEKVEPAPVVAPSAAPIPERVVAATPWPWMEMIAIAWLVGSGVWLTSAAVRLVRFGRMLRFGGPASPELHSLAHQLAEEMGLGLRCPKLIVVPGKISPMLWALWGAPRLVLPSELIARLPRDQLATMLVHELAHWRRRDDRTRWLEIIVFALYWWCPLVWWARRELHQAEEECCDAWVVSQLPESAKAYALALVETVDFLSDAPTTLPTAASGLGHVRLLKRRLTMILNGKTPRALTLTSLLGVAGVGLLLLPLVPSWAQTSQNDDAYEQQQREKKGDREKTSGVPGNDLQKLRADVQRLQAEMELRRAEMDQRMAQIRKLMDQLQRLEQSNRDGGRNPFGKDGGEKKKGPFGPMDPGFPGGQGGKGGNRPGGGAGGAPGFPGGGAGGGAPGMPGGGGGGAFPPGGFGGNPNNLPARGGPDQRLNDVERKLDQVLQEIRSLRNDMKARPGAGAGKPRDPMNNPTPMPNPIRRPAAVVPPTPPMVSSAPVEN